MNYKILGNVGLCIILVCVGLFFTQKIFYAPDVVTLLKPPIQQSAEVNYLGKELVIEDYQVTFGQVGHKVDASFTIHNKSDLDVKNMTVLCTMYDEQGKQWSDSRWKIFDSLEAGQKEQFLFSDKRFISHRAVSHRSVCTIIDLVVVGQDVPVVSVADGHYHKKDASHH